MASGTTVAKKELLDIISDVKYLLIYGILVIIVVSSTIEGVEQFKSGIFSFSSTAGSLDLSALPYMLQETLNHISIIGGLLAIIVSFDMVNKEASQGTLKVMMSYPIFRDQILIGKYVGGFIAMVLAAVSSLSVGLGAMIGLTGMPLTGDVVIRLLLFTLVSAVYMAVFFGIGLLTSIRIKNTSNSLLASVTIWIVSLFLLTSLGNLAASLDGTPQYSFYESSDLNMTSGGAIVTVITDEYQAGPGDMAREILNFVSPSRCYGITVSELLEVTRYEFTDMMPVIVPNSLSDSLANVLPSMVVLAVYLVLTFAACYVSFNRINIS